MWRRTISKGNLLEEFNRETEKSFVVDGGLKDTLLEYKT